MRFQGHRRRRQEDDGYSNNNKRSNGSNTHPLKSAILISRASRSEVRCLRVKLHLEPRFYVYTWNIPCISHVYAVLIDIPRISMYIHGYTRYIQRGGYTWYIHGYPCISIMYIPRISMDIHGISIDVYPWYIRGISMDIPRFLNPDF